MFAFFTSLIPFASYGGARVFNRYGECRFDGAEVAVMGDTGWRKIPASWNGFHEVNSASTQLLPRIRSRLYTVEPDRQTMPGFQLSNTETFAIQFGISIFCGHSGSQLPQLVQLVARCESFIITLKRNFAVITSL